MSESVIHVKKVDDKKWGLYLDDHLLGTSKLNCDTMLAACKLAKLFDPEPEVINHFNRGVA